MAALRWHAALTGTNLWHAACEVALAMGIGRVFLGVASGPDRIEGTSRFNDEQIGALRQMAVIAAGFAKTSAGVPAHRGHRKGANAASAAMRSNLLLRSEQHCVPQERLARQLNDQALIDRRALTASLLGQQRCDHWRCRERLPGSDAGFRPRPAPPGGSAQRRSRSLNLRGLS
jgi:hypothetical protein